MQSQKKPGKRTAIASLVARFNPTIETVTQYCARCGININTFYYWRKRLCSDPEKTVPTFIPAIVKDNTANNEHAPLKRPRIIAHLPNGITMSIPLAQGTYELNEIVELLQKCDRV